ncbi:MAG TPA: hypothetical protein VIY48_18595 [Candidatus Paceibacterota bacterium]
MAWPKGKPRGKKVGGRKKGTPNKSTVSVKEALQAAFDGMGGMEALKVWGQQEPTEFYKLWSKMLPQEVKSEISGKDGAPIAPVLNVTVGSQPKS